MSAGNIATRGPCSAVLLCLSLGGAAEAADIFYSVGISPSDLKTGAPTLTLAAGTATLTVAQTGMIGVGDVITYNGTSKVYIRVVLSQTQFATQTVTGGLPANVAGATVDSIRRVFSALEGAGGAIANSRLPAYLGSGNLVALGHTLTFVLYNDGPFGVTSQIRLSQGGANPYTTDATRYVTVTAASASQVASVVSQRHSGRAGTGAMLEVGGNNIGGADGAVIFLDLPYTRVEWLVLDGNSFVGHDGIYLDTGANNALLRNLIVHDIGALDLANCAGAGNDCSGIGNAAASVQIRNCIIYDYGQDAIYSGGAGLVVANSTLFRSKSTPNVGEGLQLGGGTATAENVMALGNDRDFCAQGVCGGTLVCNNCLSADASADDFGGAGNLINRPAASQFASTAAPVDLHLRSSSAAVNAGKDLSVSFTDDIDAQTRPLGAAWDIGADEAGAQMLVKSGTYMGNGTTQSIVGIGFRPDLVMITSDSSTSGLGIFPSGHTAVLRTSTMTGNVSAAAYVYAYPPLANRITSLDANGFSVSHPASHAATNDDPNDPYHCANHAGVRYYWVAFQAAPGEMAVGTYTGNGAATQDVTTVGFQPDYTLVLPSDGGDPIHRFRLMPANYSFDLDGGSQCPAGCSRSPESGIRTELANGFQVGQYVNNNAVVYHYVAWKNTAGRIKIDTYTGDGNDDVTISGLGFRPEMVQIANGLLPTPNATVTFKTASSGSSYDYSLVYVAYASGYQGPDAIQALLADGFQIGQDTNVNSGGEPHYYAAFGPGLPTAATTNYRSIGAAGPYSTGSVTVTNGSTTVTGVGTAWRANNRGRGDVLTVGGVPYTVVWIGSDTNLRLTTPYAGATGTFAYTIARQFSTLAAWENCIDGGGTSCGAFPAVPSANLVADDRSEVGIAYDDATPSFTLTGSVTIQGSTTDAAHTILLTADPGNRHNGTAGAGVVVSANGGANEFDIRDSNVTVEWLEFVGARGDFVSPIQVWSTDGDLAQNVVLQNLLIHDFGDKVAGALESSGIDLAGDNTLVGKSMIVRNTMIWDGDETAIEGDGPLDAALVENVSIDGMAFRGIYTSQGPITVRNTIVTGSPSGDFVVGAGSFSGSHNSSTDGSASTLPLVNGQTGVTAAAAYVTPNSNLHLRGGAVAINTGLDLGSSFATDIDGQTRPAGGAWDRGADELGATTEVELLAFEARALDAAVDLAWHTASELNNLGFHLYRALSASGPFERITHQLIPGLGSSPTGTSYAYRDAGLVNGQVYYYLLEDVETTGRTQRHGPVSAVPTAPGEGSHEDPGGDGSGGSHEDPGAKRTPYGEPEKGSFRLLERGRSHVLLELWTPGFYAVPEEGGTVRLEVPGFEGPRVAGAPDVPVKQALVEVLAGRRVLVASVAAEEEVRFEGLRVAPASDPSMVVSEEGTVQAGLSRKRSTATRGLFPRTRARILEVLFQGETKKARIELSPLRHDPATGATLLARRLRVRIEFAGTETGERALSGSRGRRPPRAPSLKRQGLIAELVTPEAGLHAVRYEQVLSSPRGILASNLRLSRRGQSVAFHLEPQKAFFAPGSVLYFVSEGGKGNPWGDAVYALEVGKAGTRMPVLASAPSGPNIPEYLDRMEWEENRYYQAGLLQAPDLWLWDLLVSPVTRTYPFTLQQVATSSTAAILTVWLQGASDFEADPDHHLRVSLNGQVVGEASWDGKAEQVISAEIGSGLLLEGANELSLESVGDTAASSSMVFLNRFALTYPRRLVAEQGLLQGTFGESGTAAVGALDGGGHVLDVEAATPRWLTGTTATTGTLSFRAEPAGRYLVVGGDAVKTPQVRRPLPSRLRKPAIGAEWLLVAPREFLGAAQPLVELRLRQGLQAKTVSLEEVEQEFGGGEHGPSALKEFLEHAYHSWPKPSLRYVVLLGDGSYDPKDDLKTGVKDHISPYLVKTSYLWTASDPAYGSVNGEDLVPDLAVGRLPAASVEQARVLVDKVVAFETAGRTLGGRAILIADDADQGGDFEAEADVIAASILQGRAVEKLFVRDLAGGTRASIRAAFDNGPGLVSYLGHGGTAVWASENVFNNTDVPSLEGQAQQPLLLTLNCLNGFFHFPPLDSLAEAFLKAEGKGAVAAFSPSGLSLNQPAHLYHQALLAEIESGGHARLGDALLAAQAAYADTGALPELLSIYHLFGDPALMLWPESSPPSQ